LPMLSSDNLGVTPVLSGDVSLAFLNGGLGQPMANLGKPFGGNLNRQAAPPEGVEKGIADLLARPNIAGPAGRPEYPRHIYISTYPPDKHTIKLATARALCCPATTPQQGPRRPHCHCGIYRWQRFATTRAAAFQPMPPTAEQRYTRWDRYRRTSSLGFIVVWVSVFHRFCLSTSILMYSWGFGKLGAILLNPFHNPITAEGT